MSYTQVILKPVFTCAGCGGQFTDRHSCPTMPWGITGPGPIFVSVPQITVKDCVGQTIHGAPQGPQL